MSKAAREKLATSDPGATLPGKIGAWFGEHEEARDLVETWMDMRAAGETTWTVRRLQTELETSYRFPFVSDYLRTWLSRAYGARYYQMREGGSRS